MSDHTPENIAQTVRDILATQPDCTVLDPTHIARHSTAPLLISVPDGRKIVDLTDNLRKVQSTLTPLRRTGTAKMTDLQSVIDWANRNKDADSALFAQNSETAPSITAIADYNRNGAETVHDGGFSTMARHGTHRATYTFPLSKQWKAWDAVSGKGMTSLEMGVFLEDHILDVIDPPLSLTSPGIAGAEASASDLRLIDIARRLEGNYGNAAQLLNMAKSFTVNETSDYTVQHNSTSGEGMLVVKSEHLDANNQPIRPPKLFLIAIPVFDNGPAYRIPVRFQYRKSGSKLAFFMTLHDPQHSKDHAFTEATRHAVESTSLPLFLGQPEN